METDRRDNSTRDIATEAKTLINQHMQDCIGVRERLQDAMNNISIDMRDLRLDMKSLNNRVLLIIGGLITLETLIGFGVSYFHH